jgi:hypothetical protein
MQALRKSATGPGTIPPKRRMKIAAQVLIASRRRDIQYDCSPDGDWGLRAKTKLKGKREDIVHKVSLVTIFPPTFGGRVSLAYRCHLWSVPHLALKNSTTPYDGCGELAEFPNFESVQLLRRVQLLGHVR